MKNKLFAGLQQVGKTIFGKEEEKPEMPKKVIISSPISGIAANLSEAPDEAFAEGMMGQGAVVTPEDSVINAPEDGTVEFVFDTKHAVGFTTDTGIAMLIHVGIDTVSLEGKGFNVYVKNGQKVKKGDPLLKIDIPYLKENAPSLASPVLCTELKENQSVRILKTGEIKAGEPLLEVEQKE